MKNKNNPYLLLLSPSGHIQRLCVRMQDKIGKTEDEVQGQFFQELKHPEMPGGPFKDLWAVVTDGRPWMGILQLRDNHEAFWVNAYLVPVVEAGQVIEIHCILEDATLEVIKRAQRVYALRKLGKMPWPLKFRWPSISKSLHLATITAFTPLFFMLTSHQADSIYLLALGLSLTFLVLFQLFLLRRFNQLVANSRKIVNHPIKQLIYTDTFDDIGQLELTLLMQESQMRALMGRMQNTAEQIQAHAEQTMDSMNRMFSDVKAQMKILDELSLSGVQLTDQVKGMSLQTQQSLNSSRATFAQVEIGKQTLQSAITSIHQLAESILQSQSYFSQLENKSRQIDEIMNVVQNVAEQINLLALNAAIEAARAGEAGRGFAVVADEVRALAAKTQNSTLDIQSMISELQLSITEITQRMSDEKNLSADSVVQIEKAEASFNSILDFIADLDQQIDKLEHSSQQQKSLAEMLDTRTQQLEGLAGHTETDARHAMELNQTVASLTRNQSLMVKGLSQA